MVAMAFGAAAQATEDTEIYSGEAFAFV
jgi:hypothetical protein